MRKIIAFLVVFLSATSAWASCPATLTDCGNINANNGSFGGKVFWGVSGLHADGVTSDDHALAVAVDQCATVGGSIMLPTGKIKLTGTDTINLRNCNLIGVGIPAGKSTSVPSQGTTILLTSTGVKPFTVGGNWSISGVNFFWPNQTTGFIVYPPLLNMDGDSCNWRFYNNVVVNAYDFLADTPGHCQGEWQIHDNTIYAMHEAIRSAGQGDEIMVNRNQFSPGPWFNMDPTAVTLYPAVAAVNVAFHVENNVGLAWNIIARQNSFFAWRTIFKLDATGIVGISNVDMEVDGVGTLIDTTAGGNWAVGNGFSAWGDCSIISQVVGPGPTCFKLGAGSILEVKDSSLASTGSFVETAGSDVILQNVTVSSVGGFNDGAEYYGIHYTGGSGGEQIILQNSTLQGNGLSNKAHVHGIKTDIAPARLVVQNNRLNFFQEMIDVQSAPTTMITGNWAISTGGAATVLISGTNGVQYANNNWDKPPISALSSCGGATITTGAFSGFFQIGATNPTTACSLTFPFALLGGGGGACQFQPSSVVTVSANASGVPATWTLEFSSDVHGQNVFFNCNSSQ